MSVAEFRLATFSLATEQASVRANVVTHPDSSHPEPPTDPKHQRKSRLQRALALARAARRTAQTPGAPLTTRVRDRIARRFGVTRVALDRCLQLLELNDRVPLESFTNLGVSHFRLVARLPARSQRELLELAEQNRWSVNDLQTAVTEIRGPRKGQRGRPALPRFVRAVRAAHRELDDEALADLHRMDALTEAQLGSLRHTVAALQTRVRQIAVAVGVEQRPAAAPPGSQPPAPSPSSKDRLERDTGRGNAAHPTPRAPSTKIGSPVDRKRRDGSKSESSHHAA